MLAVRPASPSPAPATPRAPLPLESSCQQPPHPPLPSPSPRGAHTAHHRTLPPQPQIPGERWGSKTHTFLFSPLNHAEELQSTKRAGAPVPPRLVVRGSGSRRHGWPRGRVAPLGSNPAVTCCALRLGVRREAAAGQCCPRPTNPAPCAGRHSPRTRALGKPPFQQSRYCLGKARRKRDENPWAF